ncbi:MAG: glucodextranase DOMON-like domain-containing protein [Sideroxydans sp.]|nr:glucodextranase DOMON-like domain-containing protein [Sideroxydans sp.]
MKKTWLFIVLMSCMTHTFAGVTLASFADPAGDVRLGGGKRHSEIQGQEDLDLLGFRVSRDATGFWFSATFKNAIRNPKEVVRSVSSESLGDFARKGFYQFNIDVYVDMDRIAGSGNTFTLPGRHAGIAPGYAWERAVILTPRPELMRHQLLDGLHEQYPDYSSDAIATAVDQSIIFPTRIKVHGKTVDFFVPTDFFAGSDGQNWAVTAFVTGATIDVPADLSLSDAGRKPLERLQLGVMQQAAHSASDVTVADVLDGSLTRSAPESIHGLTGVVWGAAAVPATVQRKVAAASGLSIANLFQTAPLSGTPTLSSPAQESVPPDDSIAGRLQILQQLRDKGLIDESEYKQQKARILDTL